MANGAKRGGVLALGLLAVAAHPADATLEQGAAFDLSIAGVPIGDARIAVTAEGGAYAIDAAADFGFLFWGGDGAARAEGAANGDALAPARYRLAYQGVTRPGAISIDFAAGRASAWSFAPPIPDEFAQGRVAVTPDHLEGVLDPLSALVIPAPADADPDAVCRRVLPVFSGVTRFDLALEGALAASADDGGAVTCAVRYAPVSGHRADAASVARLTRPGAVALTLAPLAPGFWGPQRVTVATRFGDFEMTRRR